MSDCEHEDMVRRKELQRSTMAVWIAVLCLLIPVASSALVSSSRVEQCIDDGSDLDCEQRLVITLAVNNGQVCMRSRELKVTSYYGAH